MAKPKKHMSLQEIKKVCNEFVMHNTFFETICLSVSGEPMFNPEFSQIVQYLFEINTTSKRLFRNLSINTNATFLTEERTNLMCHFVERGYGNIQLTLSINAASKETFIKTKKVDLFDRTVKNTRYLLREKARRKIRYTFTTYLLFLVNEEVEHEAEIFRDFWVKEVEELGEKYQIDYALPTREHIVIIFKRTYANEGLFKINQAGYDDMHRRVARRLGLMPEEKAGDHDKNVPIFTPNPGKICGSPWLSPIIRHDGTLNFCLTDVDNHMPVGNVFKESFFDLWFSKEAEEFRARLAQQKFGDYDLCKNCNYFDGVKIPEVTAEEYRGREVPAAPAAWQRQSSEATQAVSCH
jgi:radical SAM protein with 4Fe4S-binding SPASM domain